ncbi:hypothetical protein [Azotobacter chroococcum]|uniref:Uncharacterized protein n=1 Tax=Azotobacter chroococcum TaxID=353 RepID=A0AAP9YI65_9GAMM|nr:hypothetical protein [Azotobacter chroococcum]QQE91128.1 hypothetical protein GKQ51_23320 [Azotobacter chroococcum]
MSPLEDLCQFAAGVDGGSFTAGVEAREWGSSLPAIAQPRFTQALHS